jgi:non-ribosomal peptide synthetase component F
MSALHLPGLELIRLDPYMSATHFDLTLNMIEEDDHLLALMEYNTDLFDESTILRMLNHYRMILEAVVENPEVQVIDVPLDPQDAQSSFDTQVKADAIFKDNQFVF